MTLRRALIALVILVLVGGAGFWAATAPRPLSDDDVAGLTGDPAHGAQVFHAMGCASCHMAEGATGDAKLVLSGGQAFPSAFGTFHAPNISPDPVHGIGGWTLREFASAVMRGVAPDGSHLYPVLPYAAYNKAQVKDVADLKSYIDTLPPSTAPSLPNDVAFPFSIRRLVGGWKLLFLRDAWVIDGDLTAEEARGRYIAEAEAHCGECHTRRNALGGLDRGKWLGGAPDPSGKGRVPDITPAKLDWTEDEIAAYLGTGFTPDYDSAGGLMAHVVENLAQLPEADLKAVAAYLKCVPAQ